MTNPPKRPLTPEEERVYEIGLREGAAQEREAVLHYLENEARGSDPFGYGNFKFEAEPLLEWLRSHQSEEPK